MFEQIELDVLGIYYPKGLLEAAPQGPQAGPFSCRTRDFVGDQGFFGPRSRCWRIALARVTRRPGNRMVVPSGNSI